MNKMLGAYQDGNYKVMLFDDGTKIRMNNLDSLVPNFPESIDMKISNRCDKGCPMCHERSVPGGALANLSHPLLDSLHPYTELALGGGNVLEHPDLESFLVKMRDKKIICNMTLHLDHFLDAYDHVCYLIGEDLIHGVGISVNKPVNEMVIKKIASIPNAVVHTIAGIMTEEGYETLYDHDIKLLILGYKEYGRGADYIKRDDDLWLRVEDLHYNLLDMMNHFKLISFDNLALEQLRVRDLVDANTWEKNYMGDDGGYTMYIDLVKEQFAKSSVSPRIKINSNRIEDLFEQVRVQTI